MHAAIAGCLVAQRLGWSASESLRTFKAALTMNIAMTALQDALAQQLAVNPTTVSISAQTSASSNCGAAASVAAISGAVGHVVVHQHEGVEQLEARLAELPEPPRQRKPGRPVNREPRSGSYRP